MGEEKVITEKWLDKHDACNAGMGWFRKNFPDGAKISDVLVGIVTDDGAEGSWVSWLMSRAKYTCTDWVSKLPLSVGGYLDLSGTGITALPEGLSVGGSLYLRGTGITALPEGLSVGGSLDLRGTGITALPEGLSVGGSLYLRGCKGIKKKDIPDRFKGKVVW